MQQTTGQALEVRLSAYIDGELGDAERAELDALLARDDDAKVMLEKLKAGSAFGNKAFEDFLHDPVPLALVRQIKQGPGINPRSERVATANLPARTVRVWPRALAAAMALLLVGGAAGFLAGSAHYVAEPESAASARPWIDEIADYHRIYSRQKDHLVEAPASDGPKIETWLASSVGVGFKTPDLASKGLTFEGARLLVVDGKPVGQLVYRDREGDIYAICFLKGGDKPQADQFREDIRDNLGLVSWQKDDASLVLVGPSADAALRELAEAVAASI
ncbi:anti-sigma factor family protein [Sinorhizobium mexicanum]|uniref:Anti-sigma factor n=1 Tax=Sinorhizobium mexicanum TaxID=375549 RepID=A0A859QVD5_9HYPH|nr:anti-sigma factor [Sinorhizobium mexicanum]MBP1883518.1 anti-sigma factor RsiW [Sinorhizobium mexicanum]QLL62711.1 anti-sigma factor [Sinorhizobium mexicanum]